MSTNKKLVPLTEEQIAMLEEKKQEIVELSDLDSLIGQAWFFRTVTYFIVGRITKRIGNFFLLEDASWIADTGRFMDCIKSGTYNECEPVGAALVNTASIVDAFPWNHQLPDKQK
jgi:hypothetical protein